MIRQATQSIFLCFAFLQWHCIQSYISPYKSPSTGYLVVDAYVAANSASIIRLTRSIPLPGDSTIPAVTGAQLQLEGTDGSSTPLADSGNGNYYLPPVQMNTATEYRLRISNVGNATYLSDFVSFKPTPPIDSINWTSAPSGVTIFANTHDPTGATRYYEWKYAETWEFTSSEQSGWVWQGDTLALRKPAQQVFTCWHTDSGTSIIVATTDQLAGDVVYEQPINFIPSNTEQLGIEYSIQVSQYALTDSGYYYLSQLKGNSEQLGSIMDPLPTQLVGNIHRVSDPSEPVLGFFSAGSVQQQRIFIYRRQVPAWLYFFECPFPDKNIDYSVDTAEFLFGKNEFTPVDYNSISNRVTYNYTSCIDCRARSGAIEKPAFWQ